MNGITVIVHILYDRETAPKGAFAFVSPSTGSTILFQDFNVIFTAFSAHFQK